VNNSEEMGDLAPPPAQFKIKRSKCKYGKKRQKQSTTWTVYQNSINNNPASDDDMEVAPAPPALAAAKPLTNNKRKRNDATWRENRGIQARDRKLESVKKRRMEDQKLAAKKLTKEKEKSAALQNEVKMEKQKRVCAEKKACLFCYCYFCQHYCIALTLINPFI